MNSYSIHNFQVQSEIVLPSDASVMTAENLPWTLHIKKSQLRGRFNRILSTRNRAAYDVGDGLMAIWHKLAFHIAFDAHSIQVESPIETERLAAKWLLNRGFGACVLLKGGLPLHAAGVEIDGRMIALVAASGTGKSTLLWSLIQSGAKFGSDDLVSLDFGTSTIRAYPSFSLSPKLCDASAEKSGVNATHLCETFPNSGEHWVTLNPSQRATVSRPLSAIYILNPCEVTHPCAEIIPEAERNSALTINTHALGAILPFLNMNRVQNLYRRLSSEVPIFALQYRKDWESLPNLCEFLKVHSAQQTPEFG